MNFSALVSGIYCTARFTYLLTTATPDIPADPVLVISYLVWGILSFIIVAMPLK